MIIGLFRFYCAFLYYWLLFVDKREITSNDSYMTKDFWL